MSDEARIEAEYQAAMAKATEQLEAVRQKLLTHRPTGRKLNYGHVGDMNHWAAQLREIVDPDSYLRKEGK